MTKMSRSSIAKAARSNGPLEATPTLAAVAISPNGKLLATAGLDKSVNLWSLETGEQIESLSGHAMGVLALAFSPDGSMLAAGGGDNRAHKLESPKERGTEIMEDPIRRGTSGYQGLGLGGFYCLLCGWSLAGSCHVGRR